jgi:hypothetical protein
VESTRKATVHPNLESIPSSYIANDLGMKLFKDAAYVKTWMFHVITMCSTNIS